MADEIFDAIKAEINAEANAMKDRLIDDILRRTNQFTQDWNATMAKLARLEEKKQAGDKLNK